MVKCSECGTPVNPQDQFCGECGAMQDKPSEVSSTTVEVPSDKKARHSIEALPISINWKGYAICFIIIAFAFLVIELIFFDYPTGHTWLYRPFKIIPPYWLHKFAQSLQHWGIFSLILICGLIAITFYLAVKKFSSGVLLPGQLVFSCCVILAAVVRDSAGLAFQNHYLQKEPVFLLSLANSISFGVFTILLIWIVDRVLTNKAKR